MTLEEIRAGIIRLLREGTDVRKYHGRGCDAGETLPAFACAADAVKLWGCGCRDVAGQADPCGHFLHGGAAHVK